MRIVDSLTWPWRLLAIALFALTMWGVGYVAKWGVGEYGIVFAVVVVALFMAIGIWIDRRDRPYPPSAQTFWAKLKHHFKE